MLGGGDNGEVKSPLMRGSRGFAAAVKGLLDRTFPLFLGMMKL
jgi:hypothetical protein